MRKFPIYGKIQNNGNQTTNQNIMAPSFFAQVQSPNFKKSDFGNPIQLWSFCCQKLRHIRCLLVPHRAAVSWSFATLATLATGRWVEQWLKSPFPSGKIRKIDPKSMENHGKSWKIYENPWRSIDKEDMLRNIPVADRVSPLAFDLLTIVQATFSHRNMDRHMLP